jgi:hypothetical protein
MHSGSILRGGKEEEMMLQVMSSFVQGVKDRVPEACVRVVQGEKEKWSDRRIVCRLQGHKMLEIELLRTALLNEAGMVVKDGYCVHASKKRVSPRFKL